MQTSQNKVVFIVLDGCRYDAAIAHLGFLNHYVEHKQASRYKVQSETPSNSRPLYEVLLTGVPMYKNHIFTNFNAQRSKQESLFSLAKKEGRTTAAAAYNWVSELYNKAPYNILEDRIQHDEDRNIQHGIFYSEDHYPDSHLFADANALVSSSNPDFVLVHSMNIDDAGHRYTSNSKEYIHAVNRIDTILGIFIPKWLSQGYQVVVTSDHGMDEFGVHGGTLAGHREVPLFIFSNKIDATIQDEAVPQLQIAPLLCFLLGIEKSEDMQELNFVSIAGKDLL